MQTFIIEARVSSPTIRRRVQRELLNKYRVDSRGDTVQLTTNPVDYCMSCDAEDLIRTIDPKAKLCIR